MALTINEAIANAQMDELGSLLDAGFIDIYDGTQPVDGDDPPDGTLLVSCQLQNPAYAAASGGSALGLAVISGTAVADGTATYAQQRNAANTQWMYASVTESGGGGDIIITDADILIGQIVTVTLSTLTQLEAC